MCDPSLYLRQAAKFITVQRVKRCALQFFSSRTRFMLETINALRNNNIRKIPNYDPAPVERARKILKNIAGMSLVLFLLVLYHYCPVTYVKT